MSLKHWGVCFCLKAYAAAVRERDKIEWGWGVGLKKQTVLDEMRCGSVPYLMILSIRISSRHYLTAPAFRGLVLNHPKLKQARQPLYVRSSARVCYQRPCAFSQMVSWMTRVLDLKKGLLKTELAEQQ